MLTESARGAPPFGRGISAVSGHMEKPMPALQLRAPDLPSQLDRVLSKGLAKAPADRQQTATELVETALATVPERPLWPRPSAPLPKVETDQTVLEASPVRTPPPMPVLEPYVPPPRPIARLPSLTFIAATAAVLVGLGIVFSIVRAAEAPPNAPPTPTPVSRTPVTRTAGLPAP